VYTHLRNDLLVRVELEQLASELARGAVVVRLSEDADRAAQRDLQVRRLHLAVREVHGELELARHVLRVLREEAPPFELY
jgi:hypothetical protein